MNKLISKVFVCLLLTTILVGCRSKSEVKIGFLMPSSVGYRWPTDLKYIEQSAAKLGAKVISRTAESDENLQLKLAKELLEEGIDVLIVVPVNSNTAAAIVRDAHEYGVPVIGYDRLIKNSSLDYLVTFDGAEIGRLMVQHAIENKPEGNYVLLWGDAADMNAHSIRNAQEKFLKPYIESGKITLVHKAFIENWSKANAAHTMKKILSLTDKKIDAVITSYDGIASGVLQAYSELNIDERIILTGQDAELEAVHAILKDKMTFTIYKSTKMLANKSVELAINLAKHEKVKDINGFSNNGRKNVPTLFLTPQAITKNNIRETVIADGFFTEQQVYQ